MSSQRERRALRMPQFGLRAKLFLLASVTIVAVAAIADDRPERIPKRAKSDAISLQMPEQKNELAEHITLTFTTTTTAKDAFILFRRKGGDGEYVARTGREINFPDGKPIPELAGWKLLYCGRRGYAIFEKEDEQVMVKEQK